MTRGQTAASTRAGSCLLPIRVAAARQKWREKYVKNRENREEKKNGVNKPMSKLSLHFVAAAVLLQR